MKNKKMMLVQCMKRISDLLLSLKIPKKLLDFKLIHNKKY